MDISIDALPAEIILRVAGELIEDLELIVKLMMTCKRVYYILSEAIHKCLGKFANPVVHNEIWRRKRLYYFHSECAIIQPTQPPLIAFDRAFVIEEVINPNAPSSNIFSVVVTFRLWPPRFGRTVKIHWTTEKEAWSQPHLAEAKWVANYKSSNYSFVEEIWYGVIDTNAQEPIWFAMGVFELDNDGNVWQHCWNNNGLWNYRVDPKDLPLVVVEPFTLLRGFVHIDGTVDGIVTPQNHPTQQNGFNWSEHYYSQKKKVLSVYRTGGPRARQLSYPITHEQKPEGLRGANYQSSCTCNHSHEDLDHRQNHHLYHNHVYPNADFNSNPNNPSNPNYIFIANKCHTRH